MKWRWSSRSSNLYILFVSRLLRYWVVTQPYKKNHLSHNIIGFENPMNSQRLNIKGGILKSMKSKHAQQAHAPEPKP